MSDFLDVAPLGRNPQYWYGLPHGYLKVDLEPSAEGLQEVARQINELPSELRDRAQQVFRLYAIVVRMLQKQQVQGCALGMHPDGSKKFSLSVLTLSTLPTPEGNPTAALTQLLATNAMTGDDKGVVPVKLPVGTGFLVESQRRTIAPSAPPDGQEEPLEKPVWQGTVAIPDTRSSSVITVQLVTPSAELADDYRGVLLGVARTVTFTDPAARTAANRTAGPFAGRGTGVERSPFG